MNEQYEVVPNIISCKDLDYLSDMFNWNYSAYKNSLSATNNVSDENLKETLNKCSEAFKNSMNEIINILNEGGTSNE